MDWIVTIFAFLILAVILAPVATLLLTFFVLVPLAHLAPARTTLARARFECPIRRQMVDTAFEPALEGGAPADVVTCSAFGNRTVTCEKRCRELARVGFAPSPMVPRFALLADDAAIR